MRKSRLMRLDAVLWLEKKNQSDIKSLTNAGQVNYSSVMAFVLVTEGGVTLGSDYLSYMISLVVCCLQVRQTPR